MNKKNCGFTLVELLVTIVILGIITGLSIPLIRNVQSSHEKRQYETYRDSLEYASKIYLDSYEEDLFGHDDIGCAIVSYQQMKGKNLVKDIPIDGVSCDTSETFVKIIKFEGQYTYQSKISCGTVKEDGSVSKEVEIPEGNVIDSTYCGLTVDTRIRFNFNPENSPIPNVKRKNIKLLIDSNTGINSQPIIQYAFSDTEDLSHMVTEWKRLDLNVPSKKKQKAVILSGNTVKVFSDFITPNNISGKLYLVLKIDRLQDLGGNNWTNTDNDIVSSGYYAVDNQAPQLNDSIIKYSEPVHRKVTPTLDFKATDNLSSESDLRMCISQDTATDTCSKNIRYIKNKTHNWVTYNKNKVLPVMENASNGESHNIFISVADQAGNYVTQQFVYYQSPSDYSITYNLDGGTHGASHPEIVDFGEEFTVSHPTKTVTPTFVNDVGATIDYSSSTVSKSGDQVPYTFSGWNISGMDESTHTFGSRTSNNIEESSVLETQFKNLRETSNGVLFDATWSSPNIVLPKIIKTGNTCKWTSPESYEWESGGTYTPTAVGGATARTFTAVCSPNTVTISYNSNGGEGTMANSVCSNGATCNLSNNTFTKSGYTFIGWYTAASGGDNVTSLTVTEDTTVYAHWNANSFTVTYNGNNANHGSMANTTCVYDQNCILASNTFTRLGYTFLGWATSANGSVSYNNQQNVINEKTSGTLNLYAVWKSNYWKVSDPEGGADTFAEALSKANDNATLTLKNSYTDSSMPSTTKSKVFVDLGGFTLSTSYGTTINSGHAMEIKNGTLTCSTTTFGVLGTLDIKSGTYITTHNAGHVVSVGSKDVHGGNFRMTGGKLTTSTVSGHSTLIVQYGGMASIENATVESTGANGSAVTVQNNAYKVYFKNNAKISASHTQAVYIGKGTNILVYALAGSSVTGTTHSIGITQGYLCLSDKTKLTSSTASGTASVWVDPDPNANVHMMGVNKGKCKDNL